MRAFPLRVASGPTVGGPRPKSIGGASPGEVPKEPVPRTTVGSGGGRRSQPSPECLCPFQVVPTDVHTVWGQRVK